MSLNNYGASIFRHGYEDRDVLDGTTEEVFRESKSTFFCRVRDNFAAERKAMFNELESKNAWHAESFLNEIEEWQNQFPEELWRLDCQKKYVDSYTETFIGQSGDPQFLKNMAQGKMKYTVKQWERGQEAYMASEYQSALAASDDAVLRCTAPEGELVIPKNYRLKLTPYDYCYLNVKYGTQSPIQVRAIPGVTYEIPFEGDSTDIIDIYSASRLQDLGDLSTTYPATVDTSKATRLKELHVGNSTEGYDNPYLTTMTLGANYLLEVLNVENVSGLTQSLNLTALNNLRELYAHGTNAGGVTFAPGGAIQVAELPAITAMSAKNLTYLTDLDIESYDKLTTLTVENCSTIDVINIFELAPNINRVRITGVDWVLTDDTLLDRIYKMSGIDLNGYNTAQSVLAGNVHLPIIQQQKLYDFQAAWPDLVITADTIIEQFVVSFVNEDGTLLEKQYVDKGGNAVDPLKREENPLPTPTKESTVQYDFTFAGWEGSLTSVFSDRTIVATYTSALRKYTIKYVAKGTTYQETTDFYGTNVPYAGINPVYTGEETGFVYYWFDHWDKSGVIDGDKTVNAVFDKCTYTEGYFDGKELADLRPVEIYAMRKLGLEQQVITDKDPYSFRMGHDIVFDDIESEELIADTTYFNGTNCIDTGIALFEEDRDFVLAVDYQFDSGCENNTALVHCFNERYSEGFKVHRNSSVELAWGASTNTLTTVSNREMLVIRHIKGDKNLYVYNSSLSQNDVTYFELTKTTTTSSANTLVFGAVRIAENEYERYGVGNIYWAKIWYTDLGDDACRKLALWTRETISLEACGFKRYYLSEDGDRRSAFSLLATHLISRKKTYSNSSSSAGGWAESTLNAYLNDRFYRAIPDNIRALIRQVDIASSAGGDSTEITTSSCYVAIPSIYELVPTMNSAPYTSEGTPISYMVNQSDRIRAYADGSADEYWTRSPLYHATQHYTNYVYSISATGAASGYNNPNSSSKGILVLLSM